MSTLLIIDDDESICYSFRRVFDGAGVKVVSARTAAEGLERMRDRRPDVVVLDLHLPDRSGMDVFREIHAEDPKRPVIFLTAHGSTETAIEAMKNGAFDYLVKPVVLERLGQLIERAFEAARLMHVPAVLPTGEIEDRIVGHSPVMQEMCKAIGRIAPQNVNVLIQGESGTGKELVARALYYHSRRMAKPFLAINCAAIPESLLESELFGHEQGSFTGICAPLIEVAKRNLAKMRYEDVFFLTADATTWKLPMGNSVVLLNNPFNEVILERFLVSNLEHFTKFRSLIAYGNDFFKSTMCRLGFEIIFRSNRHQQSVLRYGGSPTH